MADIFICSVDGCDKYAKAKGFCNPHYQKNIKYGDPLFVPEKSRAAHGEPEKWLMAHLNYESDECLIWPFFKNPKGYGSLIYKGKIVRAHNLICRIINGEPIGDRKSAAHSCGNGTIGCVNHKHLRWATAKENSEDAMKLGELWLGGDHHAAKIAEKEVLEIRSMRGKYRQIDIAKKYGISQVLVSKIQLRKIWRHVK